MATNLNLIWNNSLSKFISNTSGAKNDSKQSTKDETKNMSVKKWSAAEAAWQTVSKPKKSTRWEVILPSMQMMSYQTETLENQSSKYPWLSIQEETQIDSNPQLSTTAKERMYQEMYWKKQQDAWLQDRSNIRKQYISKQATTWSEEEDKALINMSQVLDDVRQSIIDAGGKWVNKVSDLDLVNLIWETNPYTAQILNSVTAWDIPSEYGAYFLLNEDVYEQAMKDLAQQSPAWQWESTSEKDKKDKVWFRGSLIEWAFSTVKWATTSVAKLWIDAALLPARWVEYLVSWTDNVKQFWNKAKWFIDAAANQWEEDVNWDRRFNKRWYWWGKLIWEAWLATAAAGLWWAALSNLWGTIWGKLWTVAANSKYAPQIEKLIWVAENLSQTWWGKIANWIANRAINGVEAWLTLQWVSDLVEWDLSEAKDYMDAINRWILFDSVWWALWWAWKKFANPWSKITEITKWKWGLNSKQINQIENEVKMANTTNKAENPFRTRAAEVKTEAIPKLKDDIDLISKERNELTKSMVNDWNKSTYDYLDSVNATLKDTDLWNIKIIKWKNGKWKVSGWTTAWSEAERQLKEFVDMINAQSDKGTKSLVDTIAAAKQIAKEAQIAWKTNKMTKAISEFSAMLEEDAKALYPDIRWEIGKKNGQLSELLWMRNKILDLWDDYSAIADKMGNDTDFYRFMDDLYNKWYTTEHIGNKTLWTYYTMWLRAPEMLSEQAKLFYPSVPWLEEFALKTLQKSARQTYGWLNVIAWQDVSRPRYEMGSTMYQLNQANNR